MANDGDKGRSLRLIVDNIAAEGPSDAADLDYQFTFSSGFTEDDESRTGCTDGCPDAEFELAFKGKDIEIVGTINCEDPCTFAMRLDGGAAIQMPVGTFGRTIFSQVSLESDSLHHIVHFSNFQGVTELKVDCAFVSLDTVDLSNQENALTVAGDQRLLAFMNYSDTRVGADEGEQGFEFTGDWRETGPGEYPDGRPLYVTSDPNASLELIFEGTSLQLLTGITDAGNSTDLAIYIDDTKVDFSDRVGDQIVGPNSFMDWYYVFYELHDFDNTNHRHKVNLSIVNPAGSASFLFAGAVYEPAVTHVEPPIDAPSDSTSVDAQPTSTDPVVSEDRRSLGTAQIVGISIGSIVGAAVLVVLILLLIRKLRRMIELAAASMVPFPPSTRRSSVEEGSGKEDDDYDSSPSPSYRAPSLSSPVNTAPALSSASESDSRHTGRRASVEELRAAMQQMQHRIDELDVERRPPSYSP